MGNVAQDCLVLLNEEAASTTSYALQTPRVDKVLQELSEEFSLSLIDNGLLERAIAQVSVRIDQKESIYSLEILIPIIIYTVMFLISVYLIKHSAPSAWWHIPLALVPMVPLYFALRAIMRSFYRMDELQKRIQLEALAFSFVITCFLTFSIGLLENVGFPKVSWMWLPVIMLFFCGIGQFLASRRYR